MLPHICVLNYLNSNYNIQNITVLIQTGRGSRFKNASTIACTDYIGGEHYLECTCLSQFNALPLRALDWAIASFILYNCNFFILQGIIFNIGSGLGKD